LVICLVIGLTEPVLADSPSSNHPREDYIVCSNSGAYCALISPVKGMQVTVFKRRESAKGRMMRSYSIDHVGGASIHISDDGRKIIAINADIHKTRINDDPAVEVWLDGTLKRRAYLNQIWDFNINEPQTSITGYYMWNLDVLSNEDSIGFEGSNRFVIRLMGKWDPATEKRDKDTIWKALQGPKYVIELE
jgi:hypothetical protein